MDKETYARVPLRVATGIQAHAHETRPLTLEAWVNEVPANRFLGNPVGNHAPLLPDIILNLPYRSPSTGSNGISASLSRGRTGRQQATVWGEGTLTVIRKRWIVERTFFWIDKCHRLSKDYERLREASEGFVHIAMINLLLHRIAPEQN